MIKTFLYILLPLLVSCNSYKKKKEIFISLVNPISIDRNSELITIPRDTLAKYMGKMNNNELLLVSWQLFTLPSQLDDLNKDGSWDELAFTCDFMPLDKLVIKIERIVDKQLCNFQRKTNIRFARFIPDKGKYEEADSAFRLKVSMIDSTNQYLQFEGPGWENDMIAFRNYFDERNGIDIFGKVTTRMVLDNVGINEDYHVPQNWGMDILKVGNSLGAGAIGVVYKDSLYRVSAVEKASFKIITEGPVRSILDFDFKELKINGLSCGLKHRISIIAGEFGYRSSISFYNCNDKIDIVSGIVNLHNTALNIDSVKHSRFFYTHSKQSINEEYLGMAILVNNNDYLKSYKTPDTGSGIVNTYVVQMRLSNNETSFRFLAGWEMTNTFFCDKNLFSKFLTIEAEKFSNPIIVSMHH